MQTTSKTFQMKKFIYQIICSLFLVSLIIPQHSTAAVVPAEPSASNPVSIFRQALNEFRGLAKSEKKSRIKEMKKQLKEFKKAKRAGAERPEKAVLIILAILLPPLAVYLHQQEINNKFWISLLLTLLFWLPGVIYALVVVLDADS